MNLPSLLRQEEHRVLTSVTLEGSILDLGGDGKSGYQNLLKGNNSFTTVNLSEDVKPDVLHDLENPLPFSEGSYDHVILINVLEHVFNYKQLLAEAFRVARPGGTVLVLVPFLFPVHPSPYDYWRFTGESLKKQLQDLGFSNVEVVPLGGGVFSAVYLLVDRLLPLPLRFLGFYSLRYIAQFGDWLFKTTAQVLKKKYDPADYALGYYIHCKK